MSDIVFKSPEQALKDSGLAELGPSEAGCIEEETESAASVVTEFANEMKRVVRACERLELQLDRLSKALGPR